MDMWYLLEMIYCKFIIVIRIKIINLFKKYILSFYNIIGKGYKGLGYKVV